MTVYTRVGRRTFAPLWVLVLLSPFYLTGLILALFPLTVIWSWKALVWLNGGPR